MAYSGYNRTAVREENAELTHVGPGTPCGEYMRRYWHPVAMSADLTDRPRAVRILGEDLVLFRDLGNRLGLLHRYCAHRNASLEFGRIAQRGIRCCYHGWLFDIDGTILETPAEPPDSAIREETCMGAYPVHEYNGLVFAYMGAPEARPEFPVFDTFDSPDTESVPYYINYPCNWLQLHENTLDPYHTVFLHTRVSGTQFSDSFAEMPDVEWFETPNKAGICLVNVRRVDDFLWVRLQESVSPNLSQTGAIWQDAKKVKFFSRIGLTKWIVPVDDTNSMTIGWRYFSDELDSLGKADKALVGPESVDFIGQTPQRTLEERQLYPGDYEAIVSQGPINVHDNEYLGFTDTGVVKVRAKLRQNIRLVQKGEPVPGPTKNADGVYASYPQDTVLRLANRGNDDLAFRRGVAAKVRDIVFDTDELPTAERPREITRRLTEMYDQ
jgi:nitrite reductase/ring-hydroxylating ferredoxin subunit